MNKFIPENSATVEYSESFYLRTKFIVAIAVLSAVVPFIGVIVALLVGLKGKNFSSYREQLESVAPRALTSANDTAQKILDEAQKKLRAAENEIEQKKLEGEKIISDATQKAERRLQVLNAEIENKEETTARIINDAMWQAEQHKRSARRELDRIQAEINKREFYLREVERIKENISAPEKKERSLIEKIDSLMRTRKAVNSAVKTYLSQRFAPRLQRQREINRRDFKALRNPLHDENESGDLSAHGHCVSTTRQEQLELRAKCARRREVHGGD